MCNVPKNSDCFPEIDMTIFLSIGMLKYFLVKNKDYDVSFY